MKICSNMCYRVIAKHTAGCKWINVTRTAKKKKKLKKKKKKKKKLPEEKSVSRLGRKAEQSDAL